MRTVIALTAAWFFVLGAAVGSFLNVVALRLPGGRSITGRSRCASCGRQLSSLELVPVFSYLALRGRSRCCSAALSPRYLLVELGVGVLFAAAYLLHRGDWFTLALSLVAVCLCAVTFLTDLEHFLILDRVTYPAFGAAMVIALVHGAVSGGISGAAGALLATLLGAAVTAAPIWLLWYFSGERWMGFGDVKFCLAAGALLGWQLGLLMLLASSLLGGAFGGYLLAAGRANLKTRIPFGVFLSVGTVLCVLVGQPILSWYLTLLGF